MFLEVVVMDSRTKKMTEGNVLPLLIKFSLPLMIGNIFQQLYTVVDTAIVGKGLGVSALAALGASDWLNWMVLGIVQGFAQGFSIPMAQSYGANEFERLRKVIGNSVILATVSSVVLVIISQLVIEPVLLILQTPINIMAGSILYLRVLFFGIPIVMAYNLLASILRSLGDGKTPLYAMIVAAITNIVLDLIFVLVFHWGIAGAAAATLIAQLISSIWCYARIRQINVLYLNKDDYKLDFSLDKKLFSLGFPMAFQNAIISIGGMIVQTVINTFGVAFIAGMTACNKLYGILEVAATSYGYAMVTYAGQNLGAGKIDRVRKGVRTANLLGFATAAVIGIFMLIFGKLIISLFISGTPEEVAEATQVGYQYLTVMSLTLPILYYLHVIRSTIQGLGNTVLPMVSGVAEFIMRTGTAWILPVLLGQEGVFLAEPMAWFGADIVLAISYLVTIKGVSKNSLNQFKER